MSFEEKSTWVNSVVTVLVLGIYSNFILTQLRSVPAAEIAYQKPLLLTIGAMVGMTIVGYYAPRDEEPPLVYGRRQPVPHRL